MEPKWTQKQERRRAVKIFFLSFGISLAVLLAIVIVVMSSVLEPLGGAEQIAEESEPEAAEAGLSYRPDASMGINFMVISVRERSDLPHAYTLCRFDPANERFVMVPVPPETVVTVKAKTATLQEHYDYAGSANVRLAAESMLLCDVERYVRLNRSGTVNLIDALGGLTRYFEQAYETETVSVPAGTHLLNGELLYEIANSPPKDTTPETWRLTLIGELLVQSLTAEADDRLDYLMEVFWNNVDTDLSQFDYTTRRKALTYFLRSETKQIEIFPLSGSWNEDRTEFVPGEAALAELRGIFSPVAQGE